MSTGQSILGNNMFAYCNNNPTNCSDATGTIAKICLTADGRIEDSPWRNHSPRGGGFVYHYTPQYGGESRTQRFLREVWNGIKKGAKWALDTCYEAYNRQAEVQLQQAIATRDLIADRFSTPEKTVNTLTAIAVTLDSTSKVFTALAVATAIPTCGISVPSAGMIAAVTGMLSIPFYAGVVIIQISMEE